MHRSQLHYCILFYEVSQRPFRLERRNSRASSNGDDIGTYKLEFVGEVAVEEEGGDRVVEVS